MKRIILAVFLGAGITSRILAGDATNAPTHLTLASAQDMALKNHPLISAANYRALAAQEVVKETRAGYFPSVTAYGNVVGAEERNAAIMAGSLNNSSVYDRTAGGLSASWLITDFGRTANLTDSSKFSAQAESQNASATREQVLLRANVTYFSVLQAQAVLQVAGQSLQTRQLLLERISLLAANQLKSQLDVSFARVAVQESQLLLQRAQNAADAAIASLSAALGLRRTQTFQLDEVAEAAFPLTNDVSQLVETALSHRPELLSLRNQHNAATSLARSQRDARLPTLSAVGMIGDAPWHDSHLPDHAEAGGIQLSLPLFARGLYTARQHEAELKAEADRELVRALEDRIVRDVHIAWLDLNTGREQLRTTEALVQNAHEAYDLAEARYKTGTSSIVELSQAQLNLTSAEITRANARYNVLIQQGNLDYEIGANIGLP